MPILRKTKDGHFVVRTGLGNGISIRTFQITQSGVDYLHQRGIEAEEAFTQHLLRELHFLGHISTLGTGEHGENDASRFNQPWGHSNPFPWQFKLISPPVEGYISLENQRSPFHPPGYKKVPIITCGHEVLIEIAPVNAAQEAFTTGEIFILRNNSAQIVARLPISPLPRETRSGVERSEMPRYLGFMLKEPGNYLLTEKASQIKPLVFLATTSGSMARTINPEALRICIQQEKESQWFSALTIASTEAAPYEIVCDTGEGEPLLSIECPVPLDLSWSDGFTSSVTRNTLAQKASLSLSDPIRTALRKKRAFTLYLDAGTFGHCFLRFASHRVKKMPEKTQQMVFSPEELNRLRWLNLAMRTRQRPVKSLIIFPEELRTIFARLSSQPECAQLAAFPFLPLELLPHIRALATTIKQKLP